MAEFSDTSDPGWVPEDWDEPYGTNEEQVGDVDGGILPTEIAEELGTFKNQGSQGEESRGIGIPSFTAVYMRCGAEIKTCLDEAIIQGPERTIRTRYAGENTTTTKEIKLIHEMTSEAVRDQKPLAVAAYTQRLQQMPHVSSADMIEAYFANAVMGDKAANDAVHEALETEQITGLMQKEWERTDKSGGAPNRGTVSTHQSLHRTIIKRCADYGIPAEHLIETYALDAEDQWVKTACYLSDRRDAIEDGANTTGLQQVVDAHAASLADMPDALVVEQVPDILGLTHDPDIRRALIDKHIALTENMPLTPELFKAKVQVLAAMVDDSRIKHTGARQTHLGQCRKDLEQLRRTQPSTEHIENFLPLILAVMRRNKTPADQAIATIDRWTGAALSILNPQRSDYDLRQSIEMQRRDDHIRRHAEHFAEQGDFIAAQKMLSAIAPTRDAWVGGRRRLLQMASEPSHLEPFMTGVTNMKVDDPFDTDLEIASLRIAGNTDKLISCAIEHTHAIVRGSTNTIVITDSMKLSVSDSNHLERAVTNSQYIIYAELAYNAVKAINKAALPVMARRLLPVFRGHLAFTDELSEALMATGDSEEAQAALNHILNSPPDNLNTQFSTQSRREDRLEGLWRLAQRIQRVNQARKNR